MHMKKIFVYLLLSVFSHSVFAEEKFTANDILGYWLSESGSGVIQIEKVSGKFEGKLVWLKDIFEGKVKDKLDEKNPNESLQSRSLQGLKNLTNFVFDQDDQEWKGGKIYDPKSGKTYSAYMKLKSKNELKLRGYVGFSLFGRTSMWTRQQTAIPDSHRENSK